MTIQKMPTLQEFYDSLPERAERIPKIERMMICCPLVNTRENAEEIYKRVILARKSDAEWKRQRGEKRDTLQEILRQEYSVGRGGDKNELAAHEFQIECKPVHALKYIMKYHYSMDEAIQYARESKLGKREFRAAVRSLVSDQQRIHDYVEKSNTELGGEGGVTMENSCLRSTGLLEYHLKFNDSPAERIYKAIYYMQFERHKKILEMAKSFVRQLEELEGDKNKR